MRVSIGIGGAASGGKRDFDEQVSYVQEAEKLEVDSVWSAEAWGQDAVTPLAYLAAKTERIRLGTAIMQISARVPSMTAMTALTLDALVEPLKPAMAFTLGAMGSPRTNFYNEAYRRGGWDEAAAEVQRLWVSGQREQAIARVPAQMIVQANLLGDEATVRERLSAFRDAGVTTLRVQPAGSNLDERLTTLGRVMDLIGNLN